MKEAPCLEKKCSICCNPVKVSRFFPEEKIPLNKEGKKMWNYLGRAVSEDTPDGIKLNAYECENFDDNTGLCKDYENRPEICQNSTCEDEETKDKKPTSIKPKEKFLIIKDKTVNL